MNKMVLVAIDKKSPIFAVQLAANVDGANLGGSWIKPKGCTRTDIHFNFDENTSNGADHACWYINHTRLTRSSRMPKYITDALDRAISRGVKLPLTSIVVRFGVSNGLNFVSLRVYFNPELEGFEPPRTAGWSTNDWHKDRVYTDAKKVAYIEKIKKWGEVWYPKVKAGFAGKLAGTNVSATTN